jgi:hypothetical protein
MVQSHLASIEIDSMITNGTSTQNFRSKDPIIGTLKKDVTDVAPKAFKYFEKKDYDELS